MEIPSIGCLVSGPNSLITYEMTSHASRFSYSADKPIRVGAEAMKRLRFPLLALRSPASFARALCAVEFARVGASLHVLMTERLDDAVAVLSESGSPRIELCSFTMVRPEGDRLVRPAPIADATWDRLARYELDQSESQVFSRPNGERGRRLAQSTQGARFCLPEGAIVYVLSDGASGVSIYTERGRARSRIRHVGDLSFNVDNDRSLASATGARLRATNPTPGPVAS